MTSVPNLLIVAADARHEARVVGEVPRRPDTFGGDPISGEMAAGGEF